MDARYRDVMERYQRMDPEHFNDVLDGIADALAMTDAEISEGSGISRQTINGMRGGRARIKPDKLWPLASALGADVEVFFLPDVAEAVRVALLGRQYNRVERRFGPPGNGGRQHNGGDGRGRSLSQKNGALLLARQHNAWSYKIGVSAAAA